MNREDLKFIDELKKSKELLDRDLRKVEQTNKLQAEQIKKLDSEIREYEKDISDKNRELDKMKK